MASDITLHNVDDELIDRLQAEAKRRGVPIDAIVSEALADRLPKAPLDSNGSVMRDVTGLAGAWTASDAAEFFAAIKDLEMIDEELWK
jgi:hypothetical protein